MPKYRVTYEIESDDRNKVIQFSEKGIKDQLEYIESTWRMNRDIVIISMNEKEIERARQSMEQLYLLTTSVKEALKSLSVTELIDA